MKVNVIQKHLTFSQALAAVKEGKFIKVPEWQGYWFLKGGKVKVMTFDEKELDTPWFDATVLREDWQIVERDYKHEARFASLLNPDPDVTGVEATCTPVMENSEAFEHWLDSQEIEYKRGGHLTLIVGERDMFHIGEAWGVYKTLNKPKK